MFQSYIIKIPLYLLLILKFDINGAQRREGVISYNTFMDKVVTMIQVELYERLNGSMYRALLPDHLVSVSGRRINLGEDRLSRIFGLTFKFWRNGDCENLINRGKKDNSITVRCPVQFNDLKIQLPLLDNEGIVYVVHATFTGMLVLQEGTDHMIFKRFIWNKKRYEIRNSDGEPVYPPPAAYCLKAKSPSSLKGILQTKFDNLTEHGLFKSVVVFSLQKIPKPTLKAKQIIKYIQRPRT